MKRYILFIMASGFAAASLWSQARITSNKETHQFGQIEWKKPVTVEYEITNTGDQPLVLTNITTSCACAVAQWTHTPIAPGEKGKVSAVFDAKALGTFNKSIAIYSNATPHLLYLHFKGEVVQKISDYSNTHPYIYGNILTDTNEIDFPDANRGDSPQITMSVVNQSDTPYEPVLMHLPSYIDMQKEPNVLQKGERGTITLTLNTDRLPDLGLTQTSVYLSRFAGDKVSEESEIPVSAVLLPDFSNMSDAMRLNAPVITFSETEIDLSEALTRKSKVKHDIFITNTGKSNLQISKLQLFDPAVGVDLKNASLNPGEKSRLRITLNKNDLKKKKKQLRILIISNDPNRPKVIVKINVASSK
ncbi:DUF1573 domain-containing protein [Bacteroides sp. OttesenSCG-928-M17]|nr:DUF1573 domain-containing protein [Bacteroides sp. OttesenSCG-928-M17]